MALDTSARTMPSRGGRTGQLHRIQEVNALNAREVLLVAFHSLEPADRTQRKAFSALMPEIYMLRHQGFSFPQIASLLGQCGFRLQPSSVRNYFHELLADRQDECVRRMDEQMLVLSEIKKETKGTDLSNLAGHAAAIIARQRDKAGSKVAEVFGVGAVQQSPTVQPITAARPTGEAPAAHVPPAEKSNVVAQSATTTAPPPADAGGGAGIDGSGFGLAVAVEDQTTGATRPGKKATGNTFFEIPGDPVVPDLAEGTDETKTSQNAINPVTLSCLPLQEGVNPVQRRKDVPEGIYAEGLMEHPAIPGLMLTKDERLYGALLEISENGISRTETVQEKVFRVKWTKPVPRTDTKTGTDFLTLDPELFGKGKK